jgi:hypothetical protein
MSMRHRKINTKQPKYIRIKLPKYLIKNKVNLSQWLKPTILATWGAKIGRIMA